MGGPGVFPEVDSEVLKGAAYQRWPQTKDGPEAWRRSVYVTEMRTITAPILDLFDPPENMASCARRSVTTIAPQALAIAERQVCRRPIGDLCQTALRDEAGPRPRRARSERAFYAGLGPAAGSRASFQRRSDFLKRQEEYHGSHNQVAAGARRRSRRDPVARASGAGGFLPLAVQPERIRLRELKSDKLCRN